MPLVYESPPANGALRQGEILKNVFDHRSVSPAVRLPENKVEYHQYSHEYVIVLTNDCDLDLEYRERNNIPGPGENGRIPQYRLLAYLLLCDVYAEETLKAERRGQQGSAAGMNSQEWRRVTQNQDERYHCFEEAEIVNNSGAKLPRFALDFLKTCSIPPTGIYEGIKSQEIERVALVPQPYLQQLTHRFYGFLSRVALP